MDISGNVTGFILGNTQNRAVSGNTLCDMYEQSSSLSFTPKTIVIASLGGNDLLRHINNDNIITTGKDLVTDLRRRYPSVFLIGIGVHPTKVDYANQNRSSINTALQPLLNCYVDPDPSFTSGDSDYTDSIHYSAQVSLRIREAIATNCGVQLNRL
jgi:hypothetical protein